ncbi:hypothetical protein BGX26_000204 [Mortierella sp. AD094]|nr:hypothetical protein BGX26_000204 [Mortierella sp. AD094]
MTNIDFPSPFPTAMLLCQCEGFVWLLILLAALPLVATPCDAAFGWRSQPKPHYHDNPGAPPEPKPKSHSKDPYSWDDTSSTEEIAIIQHATDTLRAYDHKSNCFKEAARTLRQNCRSIDIDLDDKTKCLSASFLNSGRRTPENFHNLQRNMTRYHAEQTALLRKHQREIVETHRLETEGLHEILNLHSKVIREVKSVELMISSLQHSLATLFDNISSQNEGIMQQSVALSNLQGLDKRLFSEHQADLEATFGSISMTIRAWRESLQTDLSRSYELSGLSQSLMAKINESNEGLEAIISHVHTAKYGLEELIETAIECTRSLLGLYNASTHDIKVSTQAMLSDLLEMFDTLEISGIAAWHNMMEGFKTEGGQFHKELSVMLEGTTSDIQNLASTSQEQIRQLNQLINEFEVRQGGFLWQLQIIHQIWRFLAGIAPKSVSEVEFAITSTIFVATSLAKGTRVALLLLARSSAVYVGCKKLLGSVPFMYIVLGIILVDFCVSLSRHRHRSGELLDGQRQGRRAQRHGSTQDYLVQLNGSSIKYHEEFDMRDELDSHCPPPYDDHEAKSPSKRFVILDRAISSQGNPTYKTPDSPADLQSDGLGAWNETFNLSLGSCTEDTYH